MMMCLPVRRFGRTAARLYGRVTVAAKGLYSQLMMGELDELLGACVPTGGCFAHDFNWCTGIPLL
jgi:hypothetical protein